MKLSVAIITYNHERFIRQAIESVLEQQVNFKYEIIVGEDCSTDHTRDIVLELCRRYPERIVPLLRDHNIGGPRNLIGVLEVCRGEYIAILEGDDYWTCPDKLQRQVDFLDQHPDYTMCSSRAVLRDDIRFHSPCLFPRQELKEGTYGAEEVIAANCVPTCTALYRRDVVLLPNSIADLKFGDWARNILAACAGEIYLMDEPMAVYRQHPQGQWASMPRADRLEESVRTLKLVDRHLNYRYSAAIARALKSRYSELKSCYLETAIMERQANHSRGATLSNLVACVRVGGSRLPGSFVDWASLLAYAFFGVRRLRWWVREGKP